MFRLTSCYAGNLVVEICAQQIKDQLLVCGHKAQAITLRVARP